MSHYDLIVIGTGPGGQKAAIQAAKLNKRVAIVERTTATVGGVCTHTGTIPSKAMREAILYLSGFRMRAIYGQAYRVKEHITMEDLLYRSDHVIRNELQVIRDQMARNYVDLIFGEATFMDSHQVCVEQPDGLVEHTADFFVIATGTFPDHPANVPFYDAIIFDTDGLLRLKELPRSIIVVGAGVIGVEYACMLAALGIQVTLVDGRPRLLDFVDAEIIEALQYRMRQIGITLRLGEMVDRIERADDNLVHAYLKSGKRMAAPALLYSAGRSGATAGLKLSALGIEPDERGRIPVNECFQTTQPHIYAVGDVIGFPSLATTAMEQGRLAACYAFGARADPIPERLLPYGIYSIPEISFVGPNEEQLTREEVPYEVGIARYRETARGQLMGAEHGMLKLMFHLDSRELLGVHVIGENATELVHIGQAVMALHGTVDLLVSNVFNYPTLAECYKIAALAASNRMAHE